MKKAKGMKKALSRDSAFSGSWLVARGLVVRGS